MRNVPVRRRDKNRTRGRNVLLWFGEVVVVRLSRGLVGFWCERNEGVWIGMGRDGMEICGRLLGWLWNWYLYWCVSCRRGLNNYCLTSVLNEAISRAHINLELSFAIGSY